MKKQTIIICPSSSECRDLKSLIGVYHSIQTINHITDNIYCLSDIIVNLGIYINLKSFKSYRVFKSRQDFKVEFAQEAPTFAVVNTVNISNLTDHQQIQFDSIADLLLKGQHCCLDAPAGTGKTFLVGELYSYLSRKKNVNVCSTTHKACSVLGKHIFDVDVRTIHSFLGLKLDVDYKTGVEHYKILEQVIQKNSIVIVDESSMINREMIGYIRNAIQDYNLTFLFVGDSFQLPPVNEPTSIALQIPNKHCLSEIVRHDNSIVAAGEYCRSKIEVDGHISVDALDTFADIQIISKSDMVSRVAAEVNEKKNPLFVSWTNKNVDSFAQAVRSKLGFPSDSFCVGEKIVLTEPLVVRKKVLANNNEEFVIEGVSATLVEGIPLQAIRCGGKVKFNSGIDLTQFRDKLSQLADIARVDRSWRTFYKMKEKVLPISFSHSCTVHRSQGSTVDNVYIDAGDILRSDIQARLMYVAITRTANKAYICV